MAELVTRLRDRGWRLTAQRRVIAETLTGDHVHLTAEEVLAAARERLPEVGRATVYSTLRELVRLGELAEMSTDRGPVRYDPNADEPHQHLVCDECGLIFDVDLPAPELGPQLRHGFVVTATEVIFRGRCRGCQ